MNPKQQGYGVAGALVPNGSPETISSKLVELCSGLNQLLESSSILADSLAGGEPKDVVRPSIPASGDVRNKLDDLIRLFHSISDQLSRANKAVGN